MSDREELTKKNHEAAAVIQAQGQLLGDTADPKVAREARDVIFEKVEAAVERCDQIARIDDRVEVEA